MTLVNKSLLALAGSVVLASCSSTPSPWSESSSLWDNPEQNEPKPIEIEAVELMALEEKLKPMSIAEMENQATSTESEYDVEEPVVLVEPKPEPKSKPVENMRSAGGLASQPAGNFAVQVVATSSLDQLTFFANQNQLSDEWIAETTVDGKVWYVLMLGVYESKAEAEQALASVQDMETKPFIRKIGSLQAVMK